MLFSCPKCHISLILGHSPVMIGVLIFPDFQLLDAAGPIFVFEIAARFSGSAPAIKLMAVTSGPVRSSSGVGKLAPGLAPAGARPPPLVAGGAGGRPAGGSPNKP